jgi:hydroxyethylthiazole kinase-like uncharacterized protein yjeF
MSALYSVAELRQIEHAALAELPSYTLMQRAGEACARQVLHLLAGEPDVHVLILAGPGNNGGDALEAAHYLAQFDLHVSVALYGDEAQQPQDARRALLRARAAEVCFLDVTASEHLRAQHWGLVVDGLLGIGLTRPADGRLRRCIEFINTLHCPVLAIDIASGLNADTGSIVGHQGGDASAIRASHTLSFIGDKPGMHTCDGQDYSGSISIDTLDIDSRHLVPARARLNALPLFASALKPRAGNTHKGSYGDVIVVGGAHGMGGAPVLAARMAAHAGSGRVFVAFVDDAPTYDSVHPELMMRQADRVEFGSATVVIGPGMGTSRHAHDVLSRALDAQGRIVIDADALNMIAAEPGLQHQLQNRNSNGSAEYRSIITPHPLEAARLLDSSTASVQTDRLQAARLLARHFNCIAILKGAGSVIAWPDGNVVINPTGNPALSTAGTGDVLSGLCGALLAQRWQTPQAALAAVWMHGKAADQLVDSGIGPVGLTASEVIPAVRTLLNQIIRDHAR